MHMNHAVFVTKDDADDAFPANATVPHRIPDTFKRLFFPLHGSMVGGDI